MSGKYCKHCDSHLPYDFFYRDSKSCDGRKNICKECDKKRALDRYHNGGGKEKQAKASLKYRKSEHGKRVRLSARKRFLRTEIGKAYKANATKRYKKKYPEKVYAKNRMQDLIKCGKVVRPEHCSLCGCVGIIHGHHPDYKKPEEVVWVCHYCHLELHKES